MNGIFLLPTKSELEIGSVVAIIATFLTRLAGGYDDGFDVLLIVMVLDYITGVTKALLLSHLKISSFKGLLGLGKKFGMIIAIVIAYQIGRLEHIAIGLDATYFRNVFIYFFICNETISVLENLTAIGVPIPKFMPKFLRQYMDRINQEKILRQGIKDKGEK